MTVAQLVIAWTIRRDGITSALYGAKRDWQICETAQAMSVTLDDVTRNGIAAVLECRGPAVSRGAV
jgi:aryl-alcohol dehydrogenase-like predicted oxidoreductase